MPTDQPLDETNHTGLWGASNQADRETGVALPLEAFPTLGDAVEAYIVWLDQVIVMLDQKSQSLSVQIAALENEKSELIAQYGAAAQKSLGLSANLIVEKISADPPQVKSARRTGTFVFIGGTLGVITWGLLWLARIALNRKTSSRLEGET
jgi:hypothetical protein